MDLASILFRNEAQRDRIAPFWRGDFNDQDLLP
jgi:hypothetical protein